MVFIARGFLTADNIDEFLETEQFSKMIGSYPETGSARNPPTKADITDIVRNSLRKLDMGNSPVEEIEQKAKEILKKNPPSREIRKTPLSTVRG